MPSILTLNGGSSSIKFALYRKETALERGFFGKVDRIGQNDARLIHFSTDYVFDGKLGRPYLETDPPHPLGAYAVSKLAGELYVQAYLPRPIIVRTSGVFGPGGLHTARGNFPELMLRLAREGKPIRVVEDHSASPTYAPWLASRSIDVLEQVRKALLVKATRAIGEMKISVVARAPSLVLVGECLLEFE